MDPAHSKHSSEVGDLLEQLAAAQTEIEAVSNRQLNEAVGTASHAMLLRQAHDAIQRADERFKQVLILSGVPYITETDEIIVSVNKAAAELLGGTDCADFIGKRLTDFVEPSCRNHFQSYLAELRKGKCEFISEQFLRLDGDVAKLQFTALVGRYGDQIAIHLIFRHSAESDNLKKSVALSKAALEATTDGILVVGLDGEILRLNGRFAEMWQLKGNQLHNNQEAIRAAAAQVRDAEEFLWATKQMHSHPESHAFDVIELIDGRIFERYSHPYRIEGKVGGRVVSFRDITERRRSEEALKRSELRFREVWNHSSDGMRLVNSDGTVIMVNDAFCKMMGKPRHELEGKPLSHAYLQENRAYITAQHQERFKNRTIKTHLETQMILWDGKKVWFEVSNSFVDLDDELPLLLGIFRDVTQRKKAELRSAAFSKLGEQLNAVTTNKEAAEVIVAAADELVTWDCCSLQLYCADRDAVEVVLNIDVIDGERRDVPPAVATASPHYYTRKTINEGPQLILRNDPYAESDPNHRSSDFARSSASLMFVPIRYGERIIGVISIQSHTPNAYDQDDLNTLQALADYCSTALQRLRADAEKQQSEKQSAAFSQLVRSLSAVETQKEAGRLIVDMADELFGWDACNIDLYFPDEKAVLGVVVIDTIDGIRTDVPPIYENNDEPSPTAKRVMTQGAELILRDAREFTHDTLPFGSGRPSASIMNVPIRHGEKTIGLFSIQSYRPNAYKTEDLAVLQLLADHCGGALERLRNAEKLRASEQRFQIVARATNDSIWDWDLISNDLTWNDTFANRFGFRPDETSKSAAYWRQRIHPDERERVINNLSALIGSGQVIWSDEYRLLRGDGSYAYIFDRGYVIHDSSGTPVRMIGVMMDISERKRIEQRHLVFSQLGQQLNTATTPHAAAQTISQVTEALFQWDAFTMSLYFAASHTIEHVLGFDTLDGIRSTITPHLLHQSPSVREQRVINHGGELILKDQAELSADAIPFGDVQRASMSIMTVPIRNQSAVVGILSVQSYTQKAYDQQDLQTLQTLADYCGGALNRIRAEEALRNSELRFHSIWENSVDGMRLADENGTIVAVNEAYCRLVGMQRAELEGKPYAVVYADNRNHAEVLAKFKSRFQQRSIEKTLTRRLTFRNGHTVDLEDTNSFIEIPGQKTLLLSLFRDITQQKSLEDELRHSQKMESVGQLAGGIAHDFNNILTVIQGHASLLLMDRSLSAKVNDSIHQISNVADRAANLTRQLLTFSRKQVMQPKHLDMNDVVANMIKLLQRVLGEDISLQVKTVPALPSIFGDPGMIEQILMNLAVNSRDAMPRGGTLLVETTSTTVTAVSVKQDCAPGDYVCLRVTDTGCGIPPAILPKIFEPFFTTKDVGKGTGLGLATVYGIVKQHHGWVDVRSTVGEGTTFEIYLPATYELNEKLEKKTVAAKMQAGHETILIVEDQDEVRNLAKIILQRLGYNLYEAPSAVEALSVWDEKKDQIDLLLTDMVMPDGMTGRELAEKLATDKPSLKVIFCSGYSSEMIGTDSILQEGINFLQKPYTPQKLAKMIRDRLDVKTAI